MVGIVIVSHSQTLAEGIRELAEQMAQGPVALATAGGIDDPENPIGTDAMKVQAAIESVYSESGVVVLMDLGSALMSTELAVEFLSPDQAANVHLCAAPLVEGAVAAVVQASVGADIQTVLREAEGALASKRQQLGQTEVDETVKEPAQKRATEGAEKLDLSVQNALGLHARPAAQFVKTANQFKADIMVAKGDQTANAKSINQVLLLNVRQGDAIVITATGPDALAALSAIEALAADNFGDAN